MREIIDACRAREIPVMLDGAQAVHHLEVDVQALGCDFYAFSAHKMYGPTGIGALYGKAALLEAMEPYQGGGDMIKKVTFEETLYNDLPYRFEAGTPNIAGSVGLGATVEYLERLGLKSIAAHEQSLLDYATAAIEEMPGVRIVGTAAHKIGVISLVFDGVHPHDVGTIMDAEGVAVRAGHHCTMPLWEHFGVPGTARASLGLYNTSEDVDALIRGIRRVREVFGH